MNKTEKFLRKLSVDKRAEVEELMRRLRAGDWSNLNIKKLQSKEDLFRLRQGKIRVTFKKVDGEISIVKIGNRNDITYNF